MITCRCSPNWFLEKGRGNIFLFSEKELVIKVLSTCAHRFGYMYSVVIKIKLLYWRKLLIVTLLTDDKDWRSCSTV